MNRLKIIACCTILVFAASSLEGCIIFKGIGKVVTGTTKAVGKAVKVVTP